MYLGVLSWCFTTLFVLAATYLAYWALRTNRVSLNVLFLLFLAIFITTLFTLLMGLIGLLAPLPLLLVSLAGLSVIFLASQARDAILSATQDGLAAIGVLRKVGEDLPHWYGWVFAFFLGIIVIRFAFLIWALPPFVWDSLTYHLTNVAEWTQRGRIVLFDTPVFRVYLPANFEVYETWFTVFLHHDMLVEAAGIPAYVLACLSVYSMGRTLGLARWSAGVAALAYSSTPALVMATTGTKNDPLMAALFLMALAIVMDMFMRRDSSPARNPAGQLTILALALLFALGTKPYILHLAPGLLVVFAVGARQGSNRATWSDAFGRATGQFCQQGTALRAVVAITMAGGLLLGFYWPLRNSAVFGSPFYPLGLQVGGKTVVLGQDYTFSPGLDRLLKNLVLFFAKFGDRKYPIVPSLHRTTGWGWVSYGLGMPALAWSLLRQSRLRALSLGLVISFLMVFLSARPDPWNMRFLAWFPALTSLAFASLLNWLPAGLVLVRRAFLWLLVLCLGLNLATTLNQNRVSVEQFARILSEPTWQRDAAKLDVYVTEEYENALEIVPKDHVLGYNVHSDGWIYPLYRADLSQRLVYVPFPADGACDSLTNEMRVRGVEWLFVVGTPKRANESVAVADQCVQDGKLLKHSKGIYGLDG